MKKTILVIAAIFFTLNLFSQCLEGGCDNGFGIYKYSDGFTYKGGFLNGNRHGDGKFYNKENKIVVDGEFKNNNLIYGTMYHKDSHYTGDFSDYKRHGKGVLYFEDGEKFVGEFENGDQHGYGAYYKANGEKYKSGMYEYGEYAEKLYKINFKNVCNKKLDLLIRFLNSNGNWETKGWFTAKPGETIYVADTENGIVYYYARTKKLEWNGTHYKTYKGKQYGFVKWEINGEKGKQTLGLPCN